MVCEGPDPQDTNPQDLIPPARHDLFINGGAGDDSDDELNDHFGYEPLAQGPESAIADYSDEEDLDSDTADNIPPEVPPIEPISAILEKEVWSSPRTEDPIEMDKQKVEQVMSAMANFTLPQASIPDWAQSISEDQWKHTLNDKIHKQKDNNL